MIKVLVKRERTGEVHMPAVMDERFVRMFMDSLPCVGCTMVLHPRSEKHMDDEAWHTTKVQAVKFEDGMIVAETKNSTYLLKSV